MKFSLKQISFDSVRRRSLYFWIRHYKSLFAILFFVLSGFAGYQWHRDLYRYTWSVEERKEYLETIAKETVFQEKKFQDALGQLQQTREIHQSDFNPGRDLFEGVRKKE